jgi:hypothetical protein
VTRDRVFDAFLASARDDALCVNEATDVARVVPDPRGGALPASYFIVFEGLEHFRRATSGSIVALREPIAVALSFPEDYLRARDARLAFRALAVRTRLVHPNVDAPAICLLGFRPGLRLRGIVEALYAVLTSQAFDVRSALDLAAARFYVEHPDRVRALRSPPLFRRRVARAARLRLSHGGARS